MIFGVIYRSEQIFFRFVIIHAFDRQTDARTDRQLSPDLTALHSMQRGKKRHHMYRLYNYGQLHVTGLSKRLHGCARLSLLDNISVRSL